MRNFSNKIWNATRFVIMQKENPMTVGKKDTKFENKLNGIVKEITDNLDNYKIGLASEKIYNYFWHWYCDECIEESKKGKISTEKLFSGLKTFLILIHPFMPFVTEAIWQDNQKLFDSSMLTNESWGK